MQDLDSNHAMDVIVQTISIIVNMPFAHFPSQFPIIKGIGDSSAVKTMNCFAAFCSSRFSLPKNPEVTRPLLVSC